MGSQQQSQMRSGSSDRQELTSAPSQLRLANPEIGYGVHDRKRKSTMPLNLESDRDGRSQVIHEPDRVKGHWMPAEDSKLTELVAHYGPRSWRLIAKHLHGRTGKSCRLRSCNQLGIDRNAFSEEEEEKLLSAHRLHGNKWALIARQLPGRTDNAVKNQWHVIMARKQREPLLPSFFKNINLFGQHKTFGSQMDADSGRIKGNENGQSSDSNSEISGETSVLTTYRTNNY